MAEPATTVSDPAAPGGERERAAEGAQLTPPSAETDLAVSAGQKEVEAAPLPSLTLVYDLALRSYDYADRRYDTIGTRAAALIGFTSLLVTGAGTVVHRLLPYAGLVWPAAVVFLGLIGFLLYHAICAFFAREVPGLPAPEVLYHRYASHDERAFRSKMVSTIGSARDRYASACDWKARHLRVG